MVNPTLAHKLTPSEVGSENFGWWMSEKLDGVRALWNGTRLISRGNRVIDAPDWFLRGLPSRVSLDGELYIDHKSFSQINGTARRTRKTASDNEAWDRVKYHVFDIVSSACLSLPLNLRYNHLRKCVTKIKKSYGRQSPLVLVKQTPIKSQKQAEKFYHAILARYGEGVVVRNPNSVYEQKRSHNFLKWKPHPEKEAWIVGYNAGKVGSKYAKALGSWRVQMDDKKKLEFNLAGRLSDSLRKKYHFNAQGKCIKIDSAARSKTPEIGDLVTYQYMSIGNHGRPRQPIYMRIRRKKR